jgi:hypothetical protein
MLWLALGALNRGYPKSSHGKEVGAVMLGSGLAQPTLDSGIYPQHMHAGFVPSTEVGL